jgi:lipopolysaccharide transport system ATP-binding protein
MEPAIKVENLSKRYRIGTNQGSYRTLRESITAIATVPWRGISRLAGPVGKVAGAANGNGPTSDFWAIKDVSFEVQPGEVVGIIGRNGAGKSTLLKVLSRITKPTSGRAEFRGRIGSLLEVGTGFHPELTGRENIYLNGSILGMSRREIARRFDEIVAFSEIETFLDTPVKRYSSGMYVRLAFAVAAHLEPEILVVDEVLAVGDQAFQTKCLGRMSEVGRSGRTVLFVSHNLATVLNLCQKVIVLDQGRLAFEGESDQGVRFYMNRLTECRVTGDLWNSPHRRPGCKPILKSAAILNSQGEPTTQVLCGEAISIELEADRSSLSSGGIHYAVGIDDHYGNRLMTASTLHMKHAENGLGGSGRVVCRLADAPLFPGRYGMTLYAGPAYAWGTDVIEPALWFDVVPADFYGNGRLPRPEFGRFLVRSDWRIRSD